MIKIKTLKVFQSVKVGKKECTFFHEKDYDMQLDGMFIIITDGHDLSEVYTPLTNVPWFVRKMDNKPAMPGEEEDDKQLKELADKVKEHNRLSEETKPSAKGQSVTGVERTRKKETKKSSMARSSIHSPK